MQFEKVKNVVGDDSKLIGIYDSGITTINVTCVDYDGIIVRYQYREDMLEPYEGNRYAQYSDVAEMFVKECGELYMTHFEQYGDRVDVDCRVKGGCE